MENQIQNNSNQIQLFENNDFGKVRIISEGNSFWIVGKDVLRALDYSPGSIRNSSDIFASIPEEWVGTKPICINLSDGRKQIRNVLCLSEQGLYFFLGRSDKPKAQKFKIWFDQEVLHVLRPIKVAATLPEPVNSDIQLFENSNFGKIRIIMKDGNPWFIAKDVCDCLGVNGRTSVSLLDTDEKDTVHTMNAVNIPQKMAIISESGLYSLVLRSRKPQAKQFKRWVTHEVLPSIRKTGGYSVNNNSIQQVLSAIENLSLQNNQLNNKIDLLASQNNQLAIENKEIRQELQVMKPKVQFYNLYVENDSTGVDCKTAAKIIGKMGRNKLFAFLRKNNLVMSDNMPYQKYVNLGLFGIKYSKTGFPVLMITKKGVEKIGQLLDSNS